MKTLLPLFRFDRLRSKEVHLAMTVGRFDQDFQNV